MDDQSLNQSVELVSQSDGLAMRLDAWGFMITASIFVTDHDLTAAGWYLSMGLYLFGAYLWFRANRGAS